jgi:iron(III) transport system permease protein
MAFAALNTAGRRVLFRPGLGLKLIVLAILMALIVLPLASTVLFTLQPDSIKAWSDVLVGRLAPNLFWEPLANTMIIGVIVAVICILLGGFLAWLVVMTNVPFPLYHRGDGDAALHDPVLCLGAGMGHADAQ